MKVTDFLDSEGVHYETSRHRPAFTAQQMASEEHVPGMEVAKPVVVRAGQRYYLCVLPACCKINLDALKRYLEADDVALADEEEMARLFDNCQLGAEPPFGHLYNLQTVLDKTLADEPKLVFQAGSHEQAIRMDTQDFVRLEKPRVTGFSYHMQ